MYRIELTRDDLKTIQFVGGRYAWSEARSSAAGEEDDGTATVELEEHEAWDMAEAFKSDTEGGHSYFPLLDIGSDLATKLFAFLDSIV